MARTSRRVDSISREASMIFTRPGSCRGDGEVALADAAVKIEVLALEAVLAASLLAAGDAAKCPLEALFHGKIEKEGEAGRKPPRGKAADLPDGLQGKPPAVCLVGDGGIGKAVAENDLSRLQSGTDHGIGVLGPGRGEEEDLRLARDVESSLVEQDLADSLPQRRAAGLLGHDDRKTLFPQEFPREPDLGGFPGPFDALKGDEPSRHDRSAFLSGRTG